MKADFSSDLRTWNNLYKRLDDSYYRTARKLDMSETELWIMYIMRERGKSLTQSDICSITFESKQTINSALKKMESNGIIELKTSEGNKKNKYLYFTEKGLGIASSTADKIIQAEENAIKILGIEKMGQMLSLYEEYIDILDREMDKIEYGGGNK